jgi:hypothetical protein
MSVGTLEEPAHRLLGLGVPDAMIIPPTQTD